MSKKEKTSGKEEEKSKENWFGDILMKFVPDDVNIVGQNPESMIKKAAKTAATISGAAALPPGFFGWITILPELMIVTKIQMNLIYKIAKFYNQADKVNETTITHVFAKFSGVQSGITQIREKVTKVAGEKVTEEVAKKAVEKAEIYILKKVSNEALAELLKKISTKIASLITAKTIGRFLVVISILIFSTLTYKNTKKIGDLAIELFSKEIKFE